MIRSLLLAISLLASIPLWAASIPVVPPPPKVEARAYLLEDYHSGRVLAEKNADKRMEPASLTKMMTAYVVEQELRQGNISLDDKVRISEKAWRMPGSRMFIEVGSQVTVGDLLKGVIIQSGNDASVALAEHVAGSEEAFVSLMNSYAKALGMTGTHYVNATGLPHKDHYTTARDLAILARAIIRDLPEHYSLYSEKEFTYNGIRQFNRNKLLWQDPTVDGIKTGHTESAGYCLVASAQRGDMRLISVVLGTKSENKRASESQKLLTYGFRFFETHKLYSAGEPLTEVRIWKGAKEKLTLGLAEDLWVTVPRGHYDDLKAEMRLPPQIIAPVEKGQVIGVANVYLGDKKDQPWAKRDLVALEAVPEGSLWQVISDEVLLWFE